MPDLLHQHVSAFTRALAGGQRHGDQEIVGKISTASKISPQLALDIYRNNTRGARIRSLEIIYPACRNILGDETFHALARDYVSADPYGAADLNYYGESFGDHLGMLHDAGRLPPDYAYMRDLARLEYRYHAACYADDDAPFDFELFARKINNVDPVYLRPGASLGLVFSPYPLYQIWELNCAVSAADNVPAQEQEVESVDGLQYLIVYRDRLTPVIKSVSDCEYCLLDAFNRGRSLQWAIDHIDCYIDVLLPRLIENRWLAGVRRDE
ncbi:MAG: putative DNA-binding domain-containing protein [Thiotrichales bacterium]|nr:MAG: putative DNA-binding domain-containing protein [Thiotrichales bacterium]